MTEMTQTTYGPDALDADVKRFLELKALKDEIEAEQSQIIDRVRSLGIGNHTAPCGLHVTVSAPNRRFNLETAIGLLPDETLEQCRAEGFDPTKVKRFLSPELLDMCMDNGKGDPRVVIR